MTTVTVVRTTLADLPNRVGENVEFTARVCAVSVTHPGTSYAWATVTFTADGDLVDARLNTRVWFEGRAFLEPGTLVTVAAEVAHDADGVFVGVRTVFPAVA